MGRLDRERARVCILDSGVEASHPLVGGLESAVTISVGEDDEVIAEEDTEGDVSGHGTACAGIVRALAPDASISSVRVLGSSFTGSGGVLLAGLRYAIEQEFDVINMSLSTTKKPFAGVLHELADSAYFRRIGARRLGAQHAGRELPVAVLVRDLGRKPRGAGAARVLLQPEPARRVLRARRERRGRRGSGAERSPCRATASRRLT